MILTLHISRSRVGQRFTCLWSQERSKGRLRLLFSGNHYGWLGWAYFLLSIIKHRLQNNVGMSFFKFVNKYFRKNFFDNVEEFRYPKGIRTYRPQYFLDLNSIGFSNKSILIFDENESSIFSRKHQNWIERKISNSKYGQIVTLRNFTDER